LVKVVVERVASLKLLVAQLVREGRHEEALEKLYELSALMPDAAEVQTSLEQVKEFFVTRYAKALGGFDQIPPTTPLRVLRSPEAMQVQRLANGRATYEDILRTSNLGRVRTLQLLCELYGGEDVYALATRGRPRVTQDLPQRDNPLRFATFARPSLPAAPPVQEVAPAQPPEPPRVAPLEPPKAELPSWRKNDSDEAFKQSFARGMSAYVGKRFDEAESAFARCLELDPRNDQAAVMLTRVKRENLK
jgi:hypothetical protein